jgi:hypothetical protein
MRVSHDSLLPPFSLVLHRPQSNTTRHSALLGETRSCPHALLECFPIEKHSRNAGKRRTRGVWAVASYILALSLSPPTSPVHLHATVFIFFNLSAGKLHVPGFLAGLHFLYLGWKGLFLNWA